MFDTDTLVSYVYHSNRLDGLSLTEEQTRRVLVGEVDPGDVLTGPDGREFEAEVVLGHERALRGMGLLAQSEAPVTEEGVQALHKALMGELLLSAGEYRECVLRYKGLLISSPPDQLQTRMAWLLDLLNSGLAKAKDPHRFSWRVHHEFITIHPFIEGNGRLARLLLNLVRLRKGLDLTVIPVENREQYSRAIIEFQQQKIRRAQEKAASAD